MQTFPVSVTATPDLFIDLCSDLPMSWFEPVAWPATEQAYVFFAGLLARKEDIACSHIEAMEADATRWSADAATPEYRFVASACVQADDEDPF